jgi:hypothetical protein
MEGWLSKKSSGLSFGFSKKYFALENFTLHWYSSPTERGSKESWDLRTCTSVGDVPPTPGDAASSGDFQISSGKKKLLLRAPTVEEKQCWLRVLAVFNNIQPTLANGGSIPIPACSATGLLSCIDALTSDGCVQGIFRESGKAEEVRAIYMAFVRGSMSVPAGADVHAVAGCLKKLLRELPETLLTNKLWSEVVAPNPTPSRIAATIAALPQVNRQIFTSLIELLYLIVCHTSVTRMDIKNISIVLTPNFTRKDQPGVVVPLEAFWSILIQNKDTVLYNGRSPTPQDKTPSKTASVASSRATTPSPAPMKSPTAAAQQQMGKPAPLQIPTTRAVSSAQSSSSPPSEPAASPSVSYQLAAQQVGRGGEQTDPGVDSIMDGQEEDLDSLFPNDDTSLLLDESTPAPKPKTAASAPPAAAVKPVAAAAPQPAAAQAKPAAAPSRPGLPVTLRLLSTHTDDDNRDGFDSPKQPRASLRTLRGGMRKKKEEEEEDEMELFGGGGGGGKQEDMMSQTEKNAEAIRQARASRAAAGAPNPAALAIAAPASPSSSSPPPTSKKSPSAPSSRLRTLGARAALKDTFGFEDSEDGLSEKGKGRAGTGGGGRKGEESGEEERTETPGVGFDSPEPKTRTLGGSAAAALNPAPASTAAPPPAVKAPTLAPAPHDSLNSSFGDAEEDFTLGSALPPAVVKKPVKTTPDDLGISRIETRQGGEEEDASLLSLASDLSVVEKAKAGGKPTPAPDDASLTFGDDTDFDITADASIKETVYGGAGGGGAGQQRKQRTPSPKGKKVQPPLSAVKERKVSEDELSLSLDDSFSNTPKGKNAAIAAASARIRAAKAAGTGGAAAATKPSTAFAPPAKKPSLDESADEGFSLDLDSQLNSPPTKKAVATGAMPKTPAPATTGPAAVKATTAPTPKPAAAAKSSAAPKPLASSSEDNSLDLLSRAGDDSLDLLSTLDMSEAPPPVKLAPAVNAAAAPGKKASVVSTPTTSAAAAAPVVQVPSPKAKAASQGTAKNEPVKVVAQKKTEVAAAPVTTATAASVESSAELSRLLREVRRLESVNLSLSSDVAQVRDELTQAEHRAEDAEAREREMSAAASSDVRAAFSRAERAAKEQNDKLTLRFQSQLDLLTKRAEEAEATSLEHRAAKDDSAQRLIDIMDRLSSLQQSVDRLESEKKSWGKEREYMEGEMRKKEEAGEKKRAEILALQAQLDSLSQSHHTSLLSSHSSTGKAALELDSLREQVRKVTNEREELYLANTLANQRVSQLEFELLELRSSLGPTGGPTSTHAALVNVRMEKERESRMWEHERREWEREKKEGEKKMEEWETRFRILLQQHTDLESAHNSLLSKVERMELQLLSKAQKISYLTKALDAVEGDHARKIRNLSAAAAVKAATVESLERKAAQLESTVERYAPSEVYAGLLGEMERNREILNEEIEHLHKEMSESSGSAVLAATLDRFPALKSIVGTLAPLPPADSSNISSPPATARYSSLTSRSGAGTYRPGIEFIPLTSRTNVGGSFSAMGAMTARQEEKEQGVYKSIPPLAAYAPFPSFSSPPPSGSLTSRPSSYLYSRPSDVERTKLFQRVSLEESRRQLMQVEAKARAQLDASQQRLQDIEMSLAQTQAQAQHQMNQITAAEAANRAISRA